MPRSSTLAPRLRIAISRTRDAHRPSTVLVPGTLTTPRRRRRRLQRADERRAHGEVDEPLGRRYQVTLGGRTLSAAVLRPAPGKYTVVFDSRSPADAGSFRFRLWINDTTPPAIRLVTKTANNGTLRVRVRDRGSGVDRRSISYRIDRLGFAAPGWDQKQREAIIDTTGLKPGRHTLVVRAADRQEAKNTENAGAILPNTREFTATFIVPRSS